MGQGRASVFSRLIAPKKAKEKEQAKTAAREEKHKKEVAHYVLINPDAFRDTSEYQEAAANAIRDKQRRTLQRARMGTVDKPPFAVSGSTVLLPNTTFPAGAWVWEDVGGVQSRTWRLGDGGAAELILLGVDPRSLTTSMEAFSTSRIKCVIPGQPGPGAPIFASARIVQRTTEAGRALQPVAEVTKAIVMSAPALVAPLGHVAPMGEMLRGVTGFVRDSAAKGDDTPVKVLAPGSGKTRTGRLWVYVRDDRPAGDTAPRAAWFAYSPDRGGEHPQAHLRGFKGALQADAYSGWPRLYASGDVQEVACWAHARRPWWDLFRSTGRDPNSLAGQALQRIRALYEIEDDIRGRAPALRKAQRQARAGPLLEQMRQWLQGLQGLLGRVSAKSDIAQAIGYSLARWKALTRYVDDGRLEIDNNAAERALRGVSLGRKNYLFMGSDAGGERAAAFYSLVETAKLNGLDPEDYLRQVFERIAEHPINRIDELLPWNIGRPLHAPEPSKMAA